ncbi:MAG: hypothetical protein DMD42_11150 [Gemmatimonadetes bacterium]|nr:MAG: hypothetical protein DMD42_11150 [Gemmatimonadota bacterium]
MKQILKNERGMALALAIVALAVVGALIVGALFSGTQEQRAGENVRRALASFGVAEEGVYDVIRGWDNNRATYAGLYPYPANGPARDSVLIDTTTSASKTGRYSGTLFKLNDQLYVVDVTAQDNLSLAGRIRGGGASQRVGLLVRIMPVVLGTPAALTSGGANVLGGNASINGNDQIPTGWTGCGPTDSAGAGVRTQTNDTVRFTGGHPTVVGSPPVLKDPTLADSAFSVYGSMTYAQLAKQADITLPAQNLSSTVGPSLTGGTCNTNVPTNWGSPSDPSGPCGQYFPIIHITGSGAAISGQEGQGVLLVDGSLDVQGGFQFFGVVVIKGKLRTSGGGGGNPAHFWGAMLVQDAVELADTTNTIVGNANILYSKCAITKALDKAGAGAMMRSRGWVQLY